MFITKFKNRLRDSCCQKWFSHLAKSERFYFYGCCKNILERERSLEVIQSIVYKTATSSLSCGHFEYVRGATPWLVNLLSRHCAVVFLVDVAHLGKCVYKCVKMAANCILFVVVCHLLFDFVPPIFSESEHGPERSAILHRYIHTWVFVLPAPLHAVPRFETEP